MYKSLYPLQTYEGQIAFNLPEAQSTTTSTSNDSAITMPTPSVPGHDCERQVCTSTASFSTSYNDRCSTTAEGPAPSDSPEAGLRHALLPSCFIDNAILAGFISFALLVVLIAVFGWETNLARRPGGYQISTPGAASTRTRHPRDPVVEVQRSVRT